MIKNLKTLLREELEKYNIDDIIVKNKESSITFSYSNIISGKEFNEKYIEFKDKIIAKVIYKENINLGGNMGIGSYWNITKDSLNLYLGYTKEGEEYQKYVKNIIYARIKLNAKIYVQSGISGSGFEEIKSEFYEIISKNADGAYDPDDDFSGLVIYNKNALIYL